MCWNNTNDYALQTAVLPNGEVIKTRRRARKSAAGFDITKMFIGAEGTLGIVTEGQKARLCSSDVNFLDVQQPYGLLL